MTNYQEAGAKTPNPNTQLNKENPAAKNNTWTILRLNEKNFEDE